MYVVRRLLSDLLNLWFDTFNTNPCSVKNPSCLFYPFDSFNSTAMEFHFLNIRKACPFEVHDERFSVIHPFMRMQVLQSRVNLVENVS